MQSGSYFISYIKFVISSQYFNKEGRAKYDFLYEGKHQSLL